jgi:cell wall-associated NlpC family hydrolase
VVAALLAPAQLQPAGADPIADKRAEAARVADKIDQLNERLEVLYEDVAEARATVSELESGIASTEAKLAETVAQAEATKSQIRDQAIQSYINGYVGFDPGLSSVSSLTDVAAAQQYSEVVIADGSDAVDQLRELEMVQNEQKAALQADMAQADAAKKTVEERLGSVEDAKREQQATLNRVNGELATLVAAEQARRAEQQRRESEAAAARRSASTRSPSIGAAPATPAPAPNARVATVLAEARAQLGKPYSWGSGGEASFDCSGFTAWVWNEAGVRLPHSSRAQLGSVTRIDVSQIQPGDLIFYGSPIHHVSLYVGNGQVIHAPHSGAVVSYGPAFRSNMVAVGRVN